MKSLPILMILFFLFFVDYAFAQVGYQKDSLQIKVYTEAVYRNGLIKEITVKKIFCDYCTDFQKKVIAEEAKRRTYSLRGEEGNKIGNGKFKHALYIRISKKEFSEIKKDSLIDN